MVVVLLMVTFGHLIFEMAGNGRNKNGPCPAHRIALRTDRQMLNVETAEPIRSCPCYRAMVGDWKTEVFLLRRQFRKPGMGR